MATVDDLRVGMEVEVHFTHPSAWLSGKVCRVTKRSARGDRVAFVRFYDKDRPDTCLTDNDIFRPVSLVSEAEEKAKNAPVLPVPQVPQVPQVRGPPHNSGYVPAPLSTSHELWSLFSNRQGFDPDNLEQTLLVVVLDEPLVDVGMCILCKGENWISLVALDFGPFMSITGVIETAQALADLDCVPPPVNILCSDSALQQALLQTTCSVGLEFDGAPESEKFAIFSSMVGDGKFTLTPSLGVVPPRSRNTASEELHRQLLMYGAQPVKSTRTRSSKKALCEAVLWGCWALDQPEPDQPPNSESREPHQPSQTSQPSQPSQPSQTKESSQSSHHRQPSRTRETRGSQNSRTGLSLDALNHELFGDSDGTHLTSLTESVGSLHSSQVPVASLSQPVPPPPSPPPSPSASPPSLLPLPSASLSLAAQPDQEMSIDAPSLPALEPDPPAPKKTEKKAKRNANPSVALWGWASEFVGSLESITRLPAETVVFLFTKNNVCPPREAPQLLSLLRGGMCSCLGVTYNSKEEQFVFAPKGTAE